MNWLQIAQLEQGQPVPVIDPGQVMNAWLSVRVPLAMEARKAQYAAYDPEYRLQLLKEWGDLQQRKADIVKSEVTSANTGTNILGSGNRGYQGIVQQGIASNAALKVQASKAATQLESEKRKSEDTWAASAVVSDPEGKQIDSSISNALQRLDQTPGPFADKIGNAVAVMISDSAPLLNSVEGLHRPSIANAYLSRLDAAVSKSNLTPEEQAQYLAARDRFLNSVNVPVAEDSNGVRHAAINPSPQSTKSSYVTGAGSIAVPGPGPVTGSAPATSAARTPAASRASEAPAAPAPSAPAGTDDPNVTVSAPADEVTTDPETGETAAVGGVQVTRRYVDPDTNMPMVQLFDGRSIPDPQAALQGQIPVTREEKARLDAKIAMIEKQLGDMDPANRPKQRIALPLYDTEPHRLTKAVEVYNQRTRNMTPEQRAAERMRLTSVLNQIGPPVEPTKREERANAVVEKGVENLENAEPATGGSVSFGATPTKSEALSTELRNASDIVKKANDYYAQLGVDIKNQKMEGEPEAKALAQGWYAAVMDATKSLSPDAQRALVDKFSVPPEVQTALRAMFDARAAAKERQATTRLTDDTLAEDNAKASAALDAAASRILPKKEGMVDVATPRERQRQLASPGNPSGDAMGADYLTTEGGSAATREALGVKVPPVNEGRADRVKALGVVKKPTTTVEVSKEPAAVTGKAVLAPPPALKADPDIKLVPVSDETLEPMTPFKDADLERIKSNFREAYKAANPDSPDSEVEAATDVQAEKWRQNKLKKATSTEDK